MTETYLNGKISVSSLAAPTAEDIQAINKLNEEERFDLLREAIERGENSGISEKSVDDIYANALKKAKEKFLQSDDAL